MMRSLYSGISGLRNHQTRMDVIGNNIANVNTTGYKTSRVIFQDIFSQMVRGGMANTDTLGGTNPLQIGLGIRLSSVDVLHTPAPFARTDNPTDMMINGDGYFIVGSPVFDGDEIVGFDKFYTRAGNFTIDPEGYLVTSHGFFVLGWTGGDVEWDEGQVGGGDVAPVPPGYALTDDIPGPELRDVGSLDRIRLVGFDVDGQEFRLTGFSVDENGVISVMAGNRKIEFALLGVGMFANPNGLEKAGNSLYREAPSSGAMVAAWASYGGAGRVDAGGLEMSNVDLATEFTDMIVTQRGFQANSRIITVSDTMLEELVNLKR